MFRLGFNTHCASWGVRVFAMIVCDSRGSFFRDIIAKARIAQYPRLCADKVALKSHNERDKWSHLYLADERQQEHFKDSSWSKALAAAMLALGEWRKIRCLFCKCQGTQKYCLCVCMRNGTAASIEERRIYMHEQDFKPFMSWDLFLLYLYSVPVHAKIIFDLSRGSKTLKDFFVNWERIM